MDMHDLRNRRISYDHDSLDDGRWSEPWGLFATWMQDAIAAQAAGDLVEASAMNLATVGVRPDGRCEPHVRTVLLKYWDDAGFVIFTNFASGKGRDLAANPRACLHVHWQSLERQVRIEGEVQRTSPDESGRYFAMRPRGSQIGAWASRQSAPIASRAELEAQEAMVKEGFGEGDVPRPPFWGGYRLAPDRFEFWQGRPSRLHDRIAFTPARTGWEAVRLQP